MISEEIQKAYFRKNLMNVPNVELKISFDTYKEMLKQDIRVVNLGRRQPDGSLPPLFGRPVTIDHNLTESWIWIVN